MDALKSTLLVALLLTVLAWQWDGLQRRFCRNQALGLEVQRALLNLVDEVPDHARLRLKANRRCLLTTHLSRIQVNVHGRL